MMDLNELAKRIALKEGVNIEVDIEQIKYGIKLLFEELAKLDNDEVIELINIYR